eukprot:scaffold172_cov355-Prasinococcus_capsulatus_cf.AAC.4
MRLKPRLRPSMPMFRLKGLHALTAAASGQFEPSSPRYLINMFPPTGTGSRFIQYPCAGLGITQKMSTSQRTEAPATRYQRTVRVELFQVIDSHTDVFRIAS